MEYNNENSKVIARYDPVFGQYDYSDSDGNMFFFVVENKHAILRGTSIKTSTVYVPSSFQTEDGNQYNVTVIGRSAFCMQQSIKHVVFQEGITELQDSLFADCGSVLSVYIPSSVRIMGEVFYRCPTFEENAGGIIYYSGTQEQWRALIDSDKKRWMMDYTPYDSVVRFINDEFFTVPQIDYQIIYDEESETEITCLRVCEEGGEFTIPSYFQDENGNKKTITHVGRSSFAGNNKIKKITIPASIDKINNDAFYQCDNLEEVWILKAETVLDIGMGAFYGCKNLKTIYVGRECEWAKHALDKAITQLVEI